MGLFNFFKQKLQPSLLSPEQLDFWNENGFLVLENFFSKEKIKQYNDELNDIIVNRKTKAGKITIDILEGEHAGKRMLLKDVDDEAIKCAYKINDLFLDLESCRELNLNEKLSRILSTLLDDTPLIINSLSFKKGSQQPFHFDTYYMPPPVLNMMAVTSICLEDQQIDAGPISYYPGSHKIPPYVFSHGGINAINSEMPQATAYINEKLSELNLKPQTFIGKTGDVFIWHAQLYHGGTPITNHEATRKTLVTHYWRKSDVGIARVVNIKNSGSYLLRKHQKV
jgi:phytanoyl-CoA hydroxylase